MFMEFANVQDHLNITIFQLCSAMRTQAATWQSYTVILPARQAPSDVHPLPIVCMHANLIEPWFGGTEQGGF